MRVNHVPILQLAEFATLALRMKAWLRDQRWQAYLRARIQLLRLGFYQLPLISNLSTLHEVLKVLQGIGA